VYGVNGYRTAAELHNSDLLIQVAARSSLHVPHAELATPLGLADYLDPNLASLEGINIAHVTGNLVGEQQRRHRRMTDHARRSAGIIHRGGEIWRTEAEMYNINLIKRVGEREAVRIASSRNAPRHSSPVIGGSPVPSGSGISDPDAPIISRGSSPPLVDPNEQELIFEGSDDGAGADQDIPVESEDEPNDTYNSFDMSGLSVSINDSTNPADTSMQDVE
jgi:hypothetical protein